MAEPDRDDRVKGEASPAQHCAAAVGRLAGRIAHEVNNPLAAIKANLAWLRGELERASAVDPEWRQVVVETEASVERVRELMKDLQAFTGGCNLPCRTPLAKAVERGARLVPVSKAGAVLETSVPADLPLAEISEARLVGLLVIALLNAVRAFGRFDGKRPEGFRVRVEAAVRGDRLLISVEDNGPGFPPEVLAELFTPAFMARGSGLAIAREYVESAGGAISAGNAASGGARLEALIPLAREG